MNFFLLIFFLQYIQPLGQDSKGNTYWYLNGITLYNLNHKLQHNLNVFNIQLNFDVIRLSFVPREQNSRLINQRPKRSKKNNENNETKTCDVEQNED